MYPNVKRLRNKIPAILKTLNDLDGLCSSGIFLLVTSV